MVSFIFRCPINDCDGEFTGDNRRDLFNSVWNHVQRSHDDIGDVKRFEIYEQVHDVVDSTKLEGIDNFNKVISGVQVNESA